MSASIFWYDFETTGIDASADRALQVAYDRQATDDEVAPLWQARKELLSSIAATGKTAGQQG